MIYTSQDHVLIIETLKFQRVDCYGKKQILGIESPIFFVIVPSPNVAKIKEQWSIVGVFILNFNSLSKYCLPLQKIQKILIAPPQLITILSISDIERTLCQHKYFSFIDNC